MHLRPRSLAAPQISPHEFVASHASKTQLPTEVSELPEMMYRSVRRWQVREDQMRKNQWIGNANSPREAANSLREAAQAPCWTSRRGEAPHVAQVNPMG